MATGYAYPLAQRRIRACWRGEPRFNLFLEVYRLSYMAMSYGFYVEEPEKPVAEKTRIMTWSYNYSALGDSPTGNIVPPMDHRVGNPAGPIFVRLTKDSEIEIDGIVADNENPGVNGVVRLYLTYGPQSTVNMCDIDIDSITKTDLGPYKALPVNKRVKLTQLTYNTPSSFMIEYEWISGTRCIGEWRMQFGVY